MSRRRYQHKSRARSAAIEQLEPRQLLSTTYYLSPSGNDKNAGTSAALPWKTITRANTQKYNAGDSLLLQGGKTFSGDLTLTAANTAGTSSSPVTISNYGNGWSTILAGNGDGLTVRDVGYVNISNLNFIGAGPKINTATGIDLFDDNGSKLYDINITNVNVSGFGFVGIGIGSTSLNAGFNDVTISHANVDDNSSAGLFSYAGNYTANPAPYGLAHTNITAEYVNAYNNTGFSGNNASGNGIELGNVNNAIIERCIAWNNGADNSSTTGGPVGIWTYNSNDVLIQYNESYDNKAGHIDGDGFDLDGGTTNSILQYNYSHDNDGAGILEAQFAKAQPSTGNIIRYNISQNDGRTQTQAGIYLWAASASDTINGTAIYGNTIYVSKSSKGSPTALNIYSATNNVTVRNNIFDVASGLKTVIINNVGSHLLFQDNDYWTGSTSAINIAWGSSTYQSLSSWRSATGEETLGSASAGLAVNPMLENAGGGGTAATADLLTGITAFQLLSNSPLINAGLNLSALGVNPGKSDYYGDALPTDTNLAIGADQPMLVKS